MVKCQVTLHTAYKLKIVSYFGALCRQSNQKDFIYQKMPGDIYDVQIDDKPKRCKKNWIQFLKVVSEIIINDQDH